MQILSFLNFFHNSVLDNRRPVSNFQRQIYKFQETETFGRTLAAVYGYASEFT